MKQSNRCRKKKMKKLRLLCLSCLCISVFARRYGWLQAHAPGQTRGPRREGRPRKIPPFVSSISGDTGLATCRLSIRQHAKLPAFATCPCVMQYCITTCSDRATVTVVLCELCFCTANAPRRHLLLPGKQFPPLIVYYMTYAARRLPRLPVLGRQRVSPRRCVSAGPGHLCRRSRP